MGYLPGDLYVWIYRYGTRPGTWTRIFPEGDQIRRPESSPSNEQKKEQEPCSRYAHEVVCDAKTKQMYMFGGNASLDDLDEDDAMGEVSSHGVRKMNDFWKMEVSR
jgi:hypothetical protein